MEKTNREIISEYIKQSNLKILGECLINWDELMLNNKYSAQFDSLEFELQEGEQYIWENKNAEYSIIKITAKEKNDIVFSIDIKYAKLNFNNKKEIRSIILDNEYGKKNKLSNVANMKALRFQLLNDKDNGKIIENDQYAREDIVTLDELIKFCHRTSQLDLPFSFDENFKKKFEELDSQTLTETYEIPETIKISAIKESFINSTTVPKSITP